MATEFRIRGLEDSDEECSENKKFRWFSCSFKILLVFTPEVIESVAQDGLEIE